MKDYTIEQKAKANDEVREKIALRFGSNVAEEIFSEVEMDEGDKIRKWLIEFVNQYGDKFYSQIIKASVISWLENQCEQNSNTIEPKFKVGDWISGYYTNYRVTAINSKGYVVEDTDGNKINILFENEKFHHLFTIADAKDGDVLVDVYGNIGIYQKKDDFDWKSYWSLGCYGGFQPFIVEHEIEGTCPATKEQRDLLFQKIKEAGYGWDAEKKESKKIEQKPVDKVEPKNTSQLTEEDIRIIHNLLGKVSFENAVKGSDDNIHREVLKRFNKLKKE